MGTIKHAADGTITYEDITIDGTKTVVVTEPDGSVTRSIERIDPNNGWHTKIVRDPSGTVVTTSDSPGGSTQVTTRFSDGEEVVDHIIKAPDGSTWKHEQFGKTSDGTMPEKTTHVRTEPDGTQHEEVRWKGGPVRDTVAREQKQQDGSTVREVSGPEGTTISTTSPTGNSVKVVERHPDGKVDTVTTTTMPDGSKVTKLEPADGTVTTTTERTMPDGSRRWESLRPDGTTDVSTEATKTLADGTSVRDFTSSSGVTHEETKPDGSIERTTTYPDGRKDQYQRAVQNDGSVDEKDTRADGTTRSTSHGPGQNGSYITTTTDGNGTVRSSQVNPDGSMDVQVKYPGGHREDTDYKADGSSTTVYRDRNGTITKTETTGADPKPVPQPFDPIDAMKSAQQELSAPVPPPATGPRSEVTPTDDGSDDDTVAAQAAPGDDADAQAAMAGQEDDSAMAGVGDGSDDAGVPDMTQVAAMGPDALADAEAFPAGDLTGLDASAAEMAAEGGTLLDQPMPEDQGMPEDQAMPEDQGLPEDQAVPEDQVALEEQPLPEESVDQPAEDPMPELEPEPETEPA